MFKKILIALKIFKELKSPNVKIADGWITAMQNRLGKARFQELYERVSATLG